MSQTTRVGCRIPNRLFLQVEERRHNHLKNTGKKLSLRSVVQHALELWLTEQEVSP